MTPDECRRNIRIEWMKLHRKADEGKINRSAIEGLINSRCREAARHNGLPANWKEYYPKDQSNG